MERKNLFKNVTKIKEAKDITVPLCIVLGVSLLVSSIAGFVDHRQEKQLNAIENIMKPIDDQMAEYRTEIKKYFSGYITSDAAHQEIIKETGLSEQLYAQLQEMDILSTLTQEDIDEICGIAMVNLSSDGTLLASQNAETSTLYATIYNKVLNQVRKNVIADNKLTVTQTVNYNINEIVARVQSQLNSVSNNNSSNNKVDAEAIRDAYIKTIVDETLASLKISTSDETNLKNSIHNAVYLKIKDKVNVVGADGKDGQVAEKGGNYWTDAEVASTINTIADSIVAFIESDDTNIMITAIAGISTSDIHATAQKEQYGDIITISWTNQSELYGESEHSYELPEIASIASIAYQQNVQASPISLFSEESKSDTLTVTYEGGKVETIPVQGLADAMARAYAKELKEFMDKTVVGITNGYVEYDGNGNATYYCGECNTELTLDGEKYVCPNHTDLEFKEISVEDLTQKIQSALDSAVNTTQEGSESLKDAIHQTDNEDLTQIEETVQAAQTYTLDVYLTLLRGMDENHNSYQSVFDMYDKIYENLDETNTKNMACYGLANGSITPHIISKAGTDNETVILTYLIENGYVVRNDDQNLQFVGTTLDEKLENAYESQIVTIMQKYLTYMSSDEELSSDSPSIHTQLDALAHNLMNISQALNLLYGKGLVITMNEADAFDTSTHTYTYHLDDDCISVIYELADVSITDLADVVLDYHCVTDMTGDASVYKNALGKYGAIQNVVLTCDDTGADIIVKLDPAVYVTETDAVQFNCHLKFNTK